MIENTAFTEWYHYVFLLIWLLLLMLGLKYYPHVESFFKAKEGQVMGSKYGSYLLVSSFLLGIILFMLMVFKPKPLEGHPPLSWDMIKYSFYGIFILLMGLNIWFTIRNYKAKSKLIRSIVLSLLMLVYFYSGMLGGLMVIGITALFIIIYTFIKFKKILTIR